ncbi:MAG TPA: hypothetical protein VKB84_14120 [Candidatus Binataceae bacterium]|nr:hypothetical protein [Candidatus Binataceae bacterium]
MLNQLRRVADEIVVAVDSRLDEAETAKHWAVADRLMRYDYGKNAQHSMAWAHTQCRGEWVLRLDGDEVVSPALVSALPRLIAQRDVLQYHIPRRWLFPDTGGWLNELPWFPDYQNRLVRNDATLWFDGRAHTSANHLLPARYIDEPIYHLNILLLEQRDRMEKMERYEARRAGLIAPGGGSINRFYLPERYARRAPSPVPDDDRAAIEAVVHAADVPQPASRAVPLFGREEIDRWWNWRTPPPEAYRARLEAIERDDRMTVGEGRQIHLRIENRGVETWPWGTEQRPEIRVSYRWLNSDGTVRVLHGMRTPFPCSVRPGDRVIVPVGVIAPDEPGNFILEFDLVHEHVRWFECPLRIDMLVLPNPSGKSNP